MVSEPACSSADRFMARLARAGHPAKMYTTEALYYMQADWICRLLDVVDEVTDRTTASLITDAIYGRFAGDGAAEADKRVREARRKADWLARQPPLPLIWPGSA